MLTLILRQIDHLLQNHTRVRSIARLQTTATLCLYPSYFLFPLLHQSSLASLFTFCISSPLPSTSTLNQLRKLSSSMALYSLIESLRCNLQLRILPHPFLHYFLEALFFSPSTFHRLAFLSGTLPSSNLRIIFNISVAVRDFLFGSAAVHQLRSQTAPCAARALPAPHQSLANWVYSPHHVMRSQMRFDLFPCLVGWFPCRCTLCLCFQLLSRLRCF